VRSICQEDGTGWSTLHRLLDDHHVPSESRTTQRESLRASPIILSGRFTSARAGVARSCLHVGLVVFGAPVGGHAAAVSDGTTLD